MLFLQHLCSSGRGAGFSTDLRGFLIFVIFGSSKLPTGMSSVRSPTGSSGVAGVSSASVSGCGRFFSFAVTCFARATPPNPFPPYMISLLTIGCCGNSRWTEVSSSTTLIVFLFTSGCCGNTRWPRVSLITELMTSFAGVFNKPCAQHTFKCAACNASLKSLTNLCPGSNPQLKRKRPAGH